MAKTQLPKPDDFKNLRLTSDSRNKLEAYAGTKLKTPKEERAEAKAFKEMMAEIKKVLSLIPASDLKVLENYGHTKRAGGALIELPNLYIKNGRTCLDETYHTKVRICFCPRNVRKPVRRVSGCHLHEDEPVPENLRLTVPSGKVEGYRTYEVDLKHYGESPYYGDMVRAINAWRAAKERTNIARNKVLYPLRKLIQNKSSLQTLAKEWPAAMGMAERLGAVDLRDHGIDNVRHADFSG